MQSEVKRKNGVIIRDEVIVIAEHVDGTVMPVTYELISCANQMAGMLKLPVRVFVTGHDPRSLALEISGKAGVDVVAVVNPGHVHYNSSVYKELFSSEFAQIKPRFICVAHTSQGLDFAPGLAIRLDSACITGVNGIKKEETEIIFSRVICNGKINAHLRTAKETTLITVQPGYFQDEAHAGEAGMVEIKTRKIQSVRVQSKGLIQSSSGISAISQAKTIVAAGRGIGEKSNLKAVKQFAGYFTGSAVGGSRPLIDLGWMDYKHQVGITGATVAPDFYIALGISGSSQHVAGMRGSGYVISINSDPNAAMFNVSDLCIVEDVVSFIEVFETVLNEKD